jgi:hypothetical protein
MVRVDGQRRLVLLVLREWRGRAADVDEGVGIRRPCESRQDERRHRHQRHGAKDLPHVASSPRGNEEPGWYASPRDRAEVEA